MFPNFIPEDSLDRFLLGYFGIIPGFSVLILIFSYKIFLQEKIKDNTSDFLKFVFILYATLMILFIYMGISGLGEMVR